MKRYIPFCALIMICWAATASPIEVSNKKIKALVEKWNEAHNEKDIATLDELYAADLIFYGKQSSKATCLKNKKELFRYYRSLEQKIKSISLELSAYSSHQIKCKFIKQIKKGETIKEYPSYLILKITEDGYQISGESDEETDSKVGYQLKLGDRLSLINVDAKPAAISKSSNDHSINTLQWTLLAAVMVVLALGTIIVRRSKTKRKQHPNEASIVYTSYDVPNLRPRKPVSRVTSARFYFKQNSDFQSSVDIKDEEELSNKDKGDAFEKYTRRKFDPNFFELLDWRSDKGADGVYPESNKYPDLRYKFRLADKEFEVECKYRTRLYHNRFDIEKEQLVRYRDRQKKYSIDIYLSLGLGGTPAQPDELFVIPLDQAHDLNYKNIARYKKNKELKFFMNPHSLQLM